MLQVMERIRPGKWEQRRAYKKVNSFLAKIGPLLNGLSVEIGGSFAKGTWLSGDHDIDVFVKFPYEKYKKSDLSDLLAKRLKKYRLVHGSRDYFQLEFWGYLFELIPVLEITKAEQAVNVTDVSPLHTRWVTEHVKEFADEIRLSKSFAKAQGVYGAESYIKGFSGYVLEVLTIYYGGFFNFMKAASEWKKQEFVDAGSHYQHRSEALEKMNKEKQGCLIVPDPVQKDRNIAAALSEEKYLKFIDVCKQFMRNPRNEFFVQRKPTLKTLKTDAGVHCLVWIEAEPVEGKKDIVGSKMLKVWTFIQQHLEREGFHVKNSGWDFDGNALFWFILEHEEVSLEKKHYGPSVADEAHLRDFITKWHHHDMHEENGRVYVFVKRKHPHVKTYIPYILEQSEYVSEVLKRYRMKIY